MPQRFVEVADPIGAARKSDPLSYLPNLTLHADGWLSSWTNLSGSTFTNASRVGDAFLHARAPSGVAKYLLLGAVLLVVMRYVLVRMATRRALAEYGHAHTE